MQVNISFMRIGWMLETDNYQFLNNIVDTGEIDLFTNQNVQAVITFIWGKTWNFFYWHKFIPFVLLNLLPVIVLPWTMFETNNSENLFYMIIHCTLIIMLTVGTVRSLYYEIIESFSKDDYWYSFLNYFQLAQIVASLLIAIFAADVEIYKLRNPVQADWTPE